MREAEASVGDVPLVASQPLYFPVSTTKLVVMSVVTLGFYELLWFYQNWKSVKEHRRLNITPAARSLFAPLFCYGLFKEIRRSALAGGLEPRFSPLGLALLWILLSFAARLPDPFWLVRFLSPLALVPIQRVVNALNQATAPSHNPNARFSAWNIAAIVIGGLAFLMAIYGAFVPEQ